MTALLLAVLLAQPPPAETVSFPTDDGGIVFADVYGTGDRGLVLAHGGRFTKESWRKQAPEFVKAGFRVLAIDFRGGDDVHLDAIAAVKYLRARGAKSIAVVGGSFGGWAAAKAAVAMPGQIDRLVLLAASGIERPERLQGRKLFVLARDDANAAGQALGLLDAR